MITYLANLHLITNDSSDQLQPPLIDLSGEHLENIKCVILKLHGIRGFYTELDKADFAYADLGNAQLWGSYLDGADFSNADLQGADLGGTYLRGANFENADLKGTHFEQADLKGARIKASQLSHAVLSNDTILPDGSTYPSKSWPIPEI